MLNQTTVMYLILGNPQINQSLHHEYNNVEFE